MQTISFSLGRQMAIATFCRAASALVLSYRGESPAIAALEVKRANATVTARRQRSRRFTVIASCARYAPDPITADSQRRISWLEWAAARTQ
jgi:hypothetical protein